MGRSETLEAFSASILHFSRVYSDIIGIVWLDKSREEQCEKATCIRSSQISGLM